LRLLIISDIHGNISAAARARDKALRERADTLIVCGDLTHFGSMNGAERVLGELSSSGKVYFVHGNCDPIALSKVKSVGTATNLHARHVSVEGFSFVGSGGSLQTPFRTRIEYTENQILQHLNSAVSGLTDQRLVLVSHNPPYGTRLDRVHSGEHVGSRVLKGFILEREPLLVACGHVHEGRGIEELGSSVVVNPGPALYGYCAVAVVEEKSVVVELCRLD